MDDLPELRGCISPPSVDEPPFSVREGSSSVRGTARRWTAWASDRPRGRDAGRPGGPEKEQTGIKNMKVSYNKVFGYYIEVAKSQTGLVPPDWARKQTTVNAERYISQELKDLEHTILSAQDKVVALEYQLFCQLREQRPAPRWPRSRRPPPPWPRWMCSPPSRWWPPSTATACPRWTAPTP